MAESTAGRLAGAESPDGAVPFVQMRGIVRRYPNGTVALAGVDVTIGQGESVAIIGRSGSGKSTLLNVLGLLDVPDAGELIIDGRRLENASDALRSQWRASELGFVFQRSHLISALSVRGNVLLGLHYSSHPAGRAEDAAEEALRAVGLESKSRVRARTLSGGEMQRVAIVRTLTRPARLWLADEPTGNLDSAQSIEIIELLRQRAAERGASLVVVTHEPDIAARMDRVITLCDGRVVADTARGTSTAATVAARRDTSTNERPRRRTRVTVRRRLARTARFVAQGVSAHPVRTRSGISAAALAVALAVVALGLAQSAAAQVTSLFDAQRATQVTAQLTRDDATAPRWAIRVDAVRSFSGVTGVEYWRHRTGIPMANGDVATADVELVEVDAAPGNATDTEVTWAATDDGLLQDGEVLLGAVLAQRLGVAQLDLTPDVTLQHNRLRVVGIVTASRSGTATGSAFVTPESTTGLDASLSGELFVETLPGAAGNVADRLQALADPYQTTRMEIDPVLQADAYKGQLQDSVSVSLQVLAIVASLAGLGAVVFVNVLSINARTAEFGVRRAFGARRREVVTLVVSECTVLGVIGAALGLATGFVSVMVVTTLAHWQPVFDLRLLYIPLLGALLLGTLGSLPPAIAAGRIQPADAVRS